MLVLIYVLTFVFGLIVGSFLNSVIYRVSVNKSFLSGRSYCPECSTDLKWHDLIPVISFLILGGKCRYCKKQISVQYPLVELATAGLFTFIVSENINLLYGLSFSVFLRILFLFLASCFLIIIFVYDLKHYIIPDKVIFPLILITGVFNLSTGYDVLNTIYSAIGASVFFLSLVLISKGKWMGMGDVKLAFFMGLFLGFPGIIPALFLAFFSGAVIGMLLIISGKKTLKSEIPFGPFLIFGTFSALFFEYEMIAFYLSLCGF